jgi:hypothetical protein
MGFQKRSEKVNHNAKITRQIIFADLALGSHIKEK